MFRLIEGFRWFIVFTFLAIIVIIAIPNSLVIIPILDWLDPPNIPIEEAIPWGVWESHDPQLILYIDPQYQFSLISAFSFPGNYSEETKVFVSFNTRGGMIGRYRPHLMSVHNIDRPFAQRSYINSDPDGFRIINGYLHVTSRDAVLIFHRLENYDPIDFNNWLPQ